MSLRSQSLPLLSMLLLAVLCSTAVTVTGYASCPAVFRKHLNNECFFSNGESACRSRSPSTFRGLSLCSSPNSFLEWDDAPNVVLEDDSSSTEFEGVRKYVEAVVQVKPEPLESNMTVLRGIPSPEDEFTSLQNIVVREGTIGLWESVINLAEDPLTDYHVGVVGSPGIGKSTTTSVFIRMLLKLGKTVVYRINEVGPHSIYEMKPSDDRTEVRVRVYDDYSLAAVKVTKMIPSLKDYDTYYLIDPGETKTNCVPSNAVRARVVLITSPNSDNWGGSNFVKRRGRRAGMFVYDSLWTLEELLAARKEIPLRGDGSVLPEQTLRDRFREVGGVPRHVFGNAREYDALLEQQSVDTSSVSPEQIRKIAFDPHVSIDAADNSRPKSSIVGYHVGEDGRKKTVVVSDLVRENIYVEAMKQLWNVMIDRGEGGRLLFEPYCRRLLAEDQRKSFQVRPCVGKKNITYNDYSNITLGGCKRIQLVVDIVEASKKDEMVLFYPVDPQYPLIDFIYREGSIFHAIQVTTGETHGLDPQKAVELLSRIKADNQDATLHIYQMVASDNFQKFVTKPVDPMSNITADGLSAYHTLVPNPNV